VGISDIYSSPIFTAPPESNHGYDVCDYRQINPVLGSEQDFVGLMRALIQRGMGYLLDFVPNHMGADARLNPWWQDVLRNGPDSAYASYFDIDWDRYDPPLAGKILLPILGDHYGRVLERGEFGFKLADGKFWVTYFETMLPINSRGTGLILLEFGNQENRHPKLELVVGDVIKKLGSNGGSNITEPLALLNQATAEDASAQQEVERLLAALQGRAGDARSFDFLDTVLEFQFYAPRFWRYAAKRINYRRFFEISSLVGLRIERQEVFEAAHRRLLQWVKNGWVTGLRLDHIDGLYQPKSYLEQLEAALAEQGPHSACTTSEATEGGLAPTPATASSLPAILQPSPFPSLYKAKGDPASRATSRSEVQSGEGIQGMLSLPALGRPEARTRRKQAKGLPPPSEAPLEGQTSGVPEHFSDVRTGATGPYVVVEKILMDGEQLRRDWPVHGTTGYEFCTQAAGLFIDSTAEEEFSRIYREFTGRSESFGDLAYKSRKQVMGLSLSNEVARLGQMLERIAREDRYARDLSPDLLLEAIREVIACLGVYRTYIEPARPPIVDDKRYLEEALRRARERNSALDPLAFDFLQRALIPSPGDAIEGRDERINFVMRFQQSTGPIMAKGWEDTALFVYNRLNALNEVGGNPARFGLKPAEFHQANLARSQEFPHTMLATSTHDTKVSEDVRARLAALSEIPRVWRRALGRWHEMNKRFKRPVGGVLAPDANEEYLFYQMLLASWPNEALDPQGGGLTLDEKQKPLDDARQGSLLAPRNPPSLQYVAYVEKYVGRLQQYMRKAVNEAKINSRWDAENPAWHEAVSEFVAAVLSEANILFFEEARSIVRTVAELGVVNSLSQLLLKMTLPGIPDFYQGTETWNLTLVDPDNRGPVDYGHLKRCLVLLDNAALPDLMARWENGLIKVFVTQKVLRFRREHARLFLQGDYTPVKARGEFADSCFAFARTHGEEGFITVVTRLSNRLGFPPVGGRWKDTHIDFRHLQDRRPLKNLFTGQLFDAGLVPLASLLATLPFALLVREKDG
jgi:(1->4)-alpha-D-glucan 1-alpha-D-glucosylmutase